jgi:hypothetical protein
MERKKKIMIVVGALAIGGLAYYMYSKKKAAGITGGSTGGGETTGTKQCQAGEPSKGGGAGKYISIADVPNRKAARELASTIYQVGGMVSVDGGTPTKITKVWRDKSKNIGALKLANGVADGKSICLA